MVAAISSPAHKFLIFELRRDADEIQNTLQRAREQALIHEGAAKDLRTCATAIAALTAQLHEAMASSERDDLLQRIASASETLIARVDRLLDARNGRARAASR
jgi:K+-sensing histidine kinase KdpD